MSLVAELPPPATPLEEQLGAAMWPLPFAPRRWQKGALPRMMARVRDGKWVLVRATTGAGKSKLIAAGIAVHLAESQGQVVVVVPSRKLVRGMSTTLRECLDVDVGRFYTSEKQPDAPVVVVCSASLKTFIEQRQEQPCSLLVLDEAHGSERDGVRNYVDSLAPSAVVGFTATPFRANERERLGLFPDGLIVNYRFTDALADGVNVPLEVVRWDGVGRDPTDMHGILLDLILEHANHLGPGVVNARSIADAEALAGYFVKNGLKAEAVHSKLSADEVDARLERLRTGGLDVVTYVSLLSEGIDLPWLRWIGLSRNTSSRTRLAQELGRILRVDPTTPDKTFAVALDPLDRVHQLGLDHPAALGEALDEEPDQEQKAEEEREGDGDGDGSGPVVAVAVDELGRWARELLRVMRMHGLAAAPNPAFAGGGWRKRRPSDKQINLLRSLRRHARWLPPEHRDGMHDLLDSTVVKRLNKGNASDLIDILMSVNRARRSTRNWTWPGTVPIAPLDMVAVRRVRGAR